MSIFFFSYLFVAIKYGGNAVVRRYFRQGNKL